MKNFNAIPTITLLTLALAGCGGSSSGSGSGSGTASGGGTGTLAVSVTDAPYPYHLIQQATIVVTQVELHRTDGTKATPDDEHEHEGDHEHAKTVSDDGFTVIDSRTRSYDLVQLQQGTKALLTRLPVREGTYDQLRLIVQSGTITLTDGRSFPLDVPSGAHSGIKVDLKPPINVTTFLSQELVLDFDLSRSFEAIPDGCKHAEEIRDFKFHPVIRAQVATDSSTIAGTVTHAGAAVPNATVTVSNGTITQTATTRADGTYVVGFLPAGTYTVTVTTDDGTASQAGVVVASGNEVTVNLGL